METKRWNLIFSGLCLALVFSVSSVEAQRQCEPCHRCDQDGDFFIGESSFCQRKCLDPFNDDNDLDASIPGGGPTPVVCPVDDDGGNDPTYSLAFNTPIAGNNGMDPWGRHNRNEIQLAGFGPFTTNLNLNFFRDRPSLPNGDICFELDKEYNPTFMQVFRGRRGRPEYWFWVFALTNDGIHDARYRVITFGEPGTLTNDWIPTVPGWAGAVHLTLTNWEVDLDNNQEQFLSISCGGEGVLNWTIDICLDNPARTPASDAVPCVEP